MTVYRLRPPGRGAAPATGIAEGRRRNESSRMVGQAYLARTPWRRSPLAFDDGCRCGATGACLVCRRWARYYGAVTARRRAWAAYEEAGW